MTAALVDFIRRDRVAWLRPGAPPEAWELLGVDDASLARWSASSECLVTLPHASPNVFHPRTRVGWYAAYLQRQRPRTHHLRVVLTHTNFSDLGWRPYAWWYLGSHGHVRVHRQFSRNKKRKHVVVSSRPAMTDIPEGMGGADLKAARAASWGADLAVSYMLIGAVIERAAGLVESNWASYVPLTALVRFVLREAEFRASGAGDWCRALVGLAQGRRVGEYGQLEPCDPAHADVFDNYSNLSLLQLLGSVTVVGGPKMAGYWSQVEAILDSLAQVTAPPDRAPQVAVVPDVDLTALAGPTPHVRRQLDDLGVEYSQGLAVAEHGRFATRGAPFALVGDGL